MRERKWEGPLAVDPHGQSMRISLLLLPLLLVWLVNTVIGFRTPGWDPLPGEPFHRHHRLPHRGHVEPLQRMLMFIPVTTAAVYQQQQLRRFNRDNSKRAITTTTATTTATTTTTTTNNSSSNRGRLTEPRRPLLFSRQQVLLSWYASSSSSGSSLFMMGRRTELGASPRKTDSRSVIEWLGLSAREVDVLRRPLGPSASRDLEERLGLVADGKTDSVVGFFRVDFRMSKANAREMISRHPQLLFMPRQEAVDRCTWLVKNLNLNKKQLMKMVLKFPRLLSYGVKASYAPLVDWFSSYLGMTTREVARLVLRLPQLFSLTPDGNVENTVRFLESLGLSRRQVCKMVLLHPEIFSYSIEEKMIPMLEWLQLELRASPDEVIQMVARYPSLLGCSLRKNLAPKFSFFREVLKASVADIRAAVVATPSLLGYSLDFRICPRAALMLERGIDPDFAKHRWLLTATSQEKFEQWVKANSGPGR